MGIFELGPIKSILGINQGQGISSTTSEGTGVRAPGDSIHLSRLSGLAPAVEEDLQEVILRAALHQQTQGQAVAGPSASGNLPAPQFRELAGTEPKGVPSVFKAFANYATALAVS